jgi:hypothetical protein
MGFLANNGIVVVLLTAVRYAFSINRTILAAPVEGLTSKMIFLKVLPVKAGQYPASVF